MSHERKKFTLYLHPENPADNQALEIIESIPRSARGEFFRHAFICGAALQYLDARLPALLATLFNDTLTAEQLVTLISQTTGWKPSQAEIQAVIKSLGVNSMLNEDNGVAEIKTTQPFAKVKNKLSKLV
ncbi:plasmid partitioning/stability family protein [Providencia sp. PROV033]|uniref:plasmid partitioning/stability family protein n=1 Tax=Providencia sp. PROV033 TaxID=2949765 RepID=UPI002348F878|nr:plasmid partitioning/stability family protein [Providencia sp. PROV033]